MYTCRCCLGNSFSASEMKNEKFLHSNKRGICKKCTTEYERNRQMIAKANKNPDNYLSCGSCDRVFSIRNTGNYAGNNQHKRLNNTSYMLRVECPFCKSEEIDRY